MKITVETSVAAPIDTVWKAYTTPDDIKAWNAASDDWHTTAASVDLREGGKFSSRMEAKDGSMGFNFAGTYTKIVPNKLIEYASATAPPRSTSRPVPTALQSGSPSTANPRTASSSNAVAGRRSSTTSPVTSRRKTRPKYACSN